MGLHKANQVEVFREQRASKQCKRKVTLAIGHVLCGSMCTLRADLIARCGGCTHIPDSAKKATRKEEAPSRSRRSAHSKCEKNENGKAEHCWVHQFDFFHSLSPPLSLSLSSFVAGFRRRNSLFICWFVYSIVRRTFNSKMFFSFSLLLLFYHFLRFVRLASVGIEAKRNVRKTKNKKNNSKILKSVEWVRRMERNNLVIDHEHSQ